MNVRGALIVDVPEREQRRPRAGRQQTSNEPAQLVSCSPRRSGPVPQPLNVIEIDGQPQRHRCPGPSDRSRRAGRRKRAGCPRGNNRAWRCARPGCRAEFAETVRVRRLRPTRRSASGSRPATARTSSSMKGARSSGTPRINDRSPGRDRRRNTSRKCVALGAYETVGCR